jgi:hypothetical protein
MDIDLEVHRGLHGAYLFDPNLGRQTCKVYPDAEAAFNAAIRGERPVPAPKEEAHA